MSCTTPGCTHPECEDLDNERCYFKVCGECGNSTASIGEQIYRAFRDGVAVGRKHPHRRKRAVPRRAG